MNDTIVSVLFYVLVAATLAFMIGWLCGEQVARRKNAETMVQELHERLKQASSDTSQDRQLNQMRRVLNDAHKHILAVSKGLKNQGR